MKLQFEPDIDYQLDAIAAVVDVFDGQPFREGVMEFRENDAESSRNLTVENAQAVGNILELSDEEIAKNVREIQLRNDVLDSPIKSANDAQDGFAKNKNSRDEIPRQVRNDIEMGDSRNFSVEMETGTGKTYVYLRTIHELSRKYGWKKFIIVVPSVAIREGVLKNLKITREHFANLYDNAPTDFYMWDAKKRGQARQFATANTLQIMVITIDSFAKDSNIMNKRGDNGIPLEFIRATRPVVIADEPQNMETDIRRAALDSLNPLAILRYSATHKNRYNLLYKLTPVDAYDRGLVKKIEVDSVMRNADFSDAFLRVVDVSRKGKKIFAKVEMDVFASGKISRKTVSLFGGEDLEDISGREAYRGFSDTSIDLENASVGFVNGKEFAKGQTTETNREDVVRYQISRTIENHFEKELKFAKNDVHAKVLSLFFIDRVANYREYFSDGSGFAKGKFAKIFEEEFAKIQKKTKFRENNILQDLAAEEVHNGYFAKDKTGVWKDITEANAAKTKDATDAYDLIMRDKEKLLSVREPLRFIFSHSALREGWDNPNVFNICTLNETNSEMKKRQEIGRGLRLPVDVNGRRIRDENVNILTVVANESYEDFSRKLQTEIEDETGISFGNRVKKAENRRRVKLAKRAELNPEFAKLWSKINAKTIYRVEFSREKLVEMAAENIRENLRVSEPRVESTKTKIVSMGEGIAGVETSVNFAKNTDEEIREIPNVISQIASRTKITARTAYDILERSEKLGEIFKNASQFVEEVSVMISRTLSTLEIDGLCYEKTGEMYEQSLFDRADLDVYIYENGSGAVEIREKDKTVYDYVDVDSVVEREFLRELEDSEDVKFYVKLPSWFTIPTPVGKYNPDWAVVLSGDEKIYFVAETKGSAATDDLRPHEDAKIKAGKAHFDALDVKYVAPVRTLRNVRERLER